jgi:hypothetical protein
MTVFGEAVRGPVRNRISATYGLLSEQQGTNHRTRAYWLE